MFCHGLPTLQTQNLTISDDIKEKNKAFMLLSSKTGLDVMEQCFFFKFFLLIIHKPIKLQFQASK